MSMLVTRADLVAYGACEHGLKLFDKYYPSGSVEYEELEEALEQSELYHAEDYLLWLTFTYSPLEEK